MKIKTVLDKIKNSWFGRLSWKHKIYSIYFVISFTVVGCLVEAPWWGALLLTLNLVNAARLSRQVPIDDKDNEA